MPSPLEALAQAGQQGYNYQDIAQYHADQGSAPPPQPSLSNILSNPTNPIGGGQYADPAMQAWQNSVGGAIQNAPIYNEQDVLQYSPEDSAANAAGAVGVQAANQQSTAPLGQTSNIASGAVSVPGTQDESTPNDQTWPTVGPGNNQLSNPPPWEQWPSGDDVPTPLPTQGQNI